ncbi:PTS transporter subunit EIIC [Spiroplasma endosymbiont of Aspidapion aeneum]|uniref:PTS transporter subunit EIIC n=1 Tax=Spiroplasma endosymbiont of Aspidapion aeneum TaxID=3066276 RepID=UPI00313F3559
MFKQKTHTSLSLINSKNNTDVIEGKTKNNYLSKILNILQEFGKALQYPIAILPFCAIFNRLGNLGETYSTSTVGDDKIITNSFGYWISHIMSMAGGVAFDNLAFFFAIGIAFGLSKDHRGEAAIAGALFYLILEKMLGEGGLATLFYQNAMKNDSSIVDGKGNKLSSLLYMNKGGKSLWMLNLGALGGIIAGSFASWSYNKFKDTNLPKALSFFGGKRFVPMVVVVLTIPVSFALAVIWPWVQLGLVSLGKYLTGDNLFIKVFGVSLYSFLNRLLIPFGLHQVLNVFFWFQMPMTGHVVSPGSGSIGTDQTTVNGDITAFSKGIEGGGLFQSGFFPIMMGGLPAAAIAMIYASPKDRRTEVAGFLGGVAGVAFLCGITEPIEFSFVFIAPGLYVIHAALTAIFAAVSVLMQIQVGFAFSAGFIDYIVSMPQAWGYSAAKSGAAHFFSNPLWLLVLTIIAAAVYFVTFSWWIRHFDIKTPGRDEALDDSLSSNEIIGTNGKVRKSTSKEKHIVMAQKLLDAVGIDNVEQVDNCATRLRLIVKDSSKADEKAIKSAGAFGMKKLGKTSLQIIVGPDVEHVAREFEIIWKDKKTA